MKKLGISLGISGLWVLLLTNAVCGQGLTEADRLPRPFPALEEQHEQFLDQVLALWEERSQSVERYRCRFQRWEYDPVFGPRDTFKTYSEGIIKYAAPDKGLFRVERIMEYAAPETPGASPQFVQREGHLGEHWICDGKSIYEHDPTNKQLIQRELPPSMRGKAIANGPLPFLFGADAQQIRQRYWIRPLPVPEDVEGEYWLEAYPKLRPDAANYKKVHVIIDHQDFLPKGLVIFDRNFDESRNPARTTFTFQNREVNWSLALQALKFWHREFYEPEVPAGWQKVVERYEPLPFEEPQPDRSGRSTQATRPGNTPRSR